ncbi:winged helix-turn-helix transcriptional regulator [Deinococcus sedimenti]|uniref:Transcriptional regulator n=1 Tax=Deinococcus sedimenti TaxID=1867090 RepID=A0ABQ2S9J4_9DEIO|nr:helix-turn-helix domain-containing protein [Deinococcus sedimenti]GGS10620.1 transcriptional regulator [Deinococcus sedimenti]
MTADRTRSGCPVSLGLDLFGDRWTLLIIRDLMFGGKRHFRELLSSAEGISSNVLADRLQMLVASGLISRSGDQTHRQKVIYRLTQQGIDLLPILLEITRWSLKYRPVSDDDRRAAAAAPADQRELDRLTAKLTREHLGDPAPVS